MLTPTKKFLLLGVFIIVAVTIVRTLYMFGDARGYAPDQPIPFSHKLHAGDNNIPCMYCHTSVEKSKHASIPSTNICMNCHSVVKVDSPWIQKIHESAKTGKPIKWVKVHDLPDFVNFSHKRHVLRGVACEECHGNVKDMEKIGQVKPLTMGFCLNCHRGETAPEHLYSDSWQSQRFLSTDGGAGHTKAAIEISKQNPDRAEQANRAVPALNKPGTPVAPVSCYTCHH
jgi:hypothetical protein